MQLINTREDVEILLRLSSSFLKTFYQVAEYFPEDEDIKVLEPLVKSYDEDLRFEFLQSINLDYNNLNLSSLIGDCHQEIINKLFKEQDLLSDKLYRFLDQKKISKRFKKYLKFRRHCMITNRREKIFARLIV